MAEFRLIGEIVSRSKATNWDEAKLEWSLREIHFADEAETCLCGHYPIIEICIIENRENGNLAEVGNCCVKKFLGLPSELIFQAVKRVRKDPTGALNAETITHAHSRGWINDWERSFYLDTMRKRKLTGKQATKRQQVNEKVLASLSKQPRKNTPRQAG